MAILWVKIFQIGRFFGILIEEAQHINNPDHEKY